MAETKPMSLAFNVDMPSDMSAGRLGFTDAVTVTVASGDPGGEAGEFAQYMRDCLAEWFDGAGVVQVQQS
ncbi:hypothetical protein [Paraburkholderia sp. GAS32]|uniref:hypothetical protein n=1 Tax=Paraburkholderia sp. GAS32 TaxID=3035129 RepID=UPI003D1D58ED